MYVFINSEHVDHIWAAMPPWNQFKGFSWQANHKLAWAISNVVVGWLTLVWRGSAWGWRFLSPGRPTLSRPDSSLLSSSHETSLKLFGSAPSYGLWGQSGAASLRCASSVISVCQQLENKNWNRKCHIHIASLKPPCFTFSQIFGHTQKAYIH